MFPFKSAISLTFVLYTFVLMYPNRTESSSVKSGERAIQEIASPLLVRLPLYFSFNHVCMQRKKLNNKMILQEDRVLPGPDFQRSSCIVQ